MIATGAEKLKKFTWEAKPAPVVLPAQEPERSQDAAIRRALASLRDDVNELQDRPTATSTTVYVQSPVGPVTLLASESIPAYQVVTSHGLNANSSTLGHIGRVVGISMGAIASGFTGPIAQSGSLTNPAWSWTPGVLLYLNGTTISATAPSTGFSQKVGVAVTATTMIVEMDDPILL